MADDDYMTALHAEYGMRRAIGLMNGFYGDDYDSAVRRACKIGTAKYAAALVAGGYLPKPKVVSK